MFPVSVVVSRTKIPNIDFKKIFFIPRLEFLQIADNLFNKPITVAAERLGKPEFAHESKVVLRPFQSRN